jgi:CubicO group peptidase (beta-lactamase class C family)
VRSKARSAALAALLLLAACSDDDAPDPERASAPAAEEEPAVDAAALDAIAADAEAAGSTCFLVTRDGEVEGPWTFGDGEPQEVWSVTKSITSVLVGIAADDGDLELDDPASTWIPEWRGTPSEVVTVRDLLSNTSGRHWSFESDYVRLIGAEDRTAYGIGLAQDHAPGEVWAYNNAAIQTLEAVLEGATGRDVASFAEERLFEPLGMDDTTMTKDAAGNTLTFMGAQSTCTDLAKFGQLVLDDGAGIVSAEYLEEATGAPSSELNAAYGYLFWLNREGRIADGDRAASAGAADDEVETGQYVEGAPEDVVWAIGLGNQVVQVDPGSGTVVVRLGDDPFATGEETFGPADTARVLSEALP